MLYIYIMYGIFIALFKIKTNILITLYIYIYTHTHIYTHIHKSSNREILRNWLTWLWGLVSLKFVGRASRLEIQVRVDVVVFGLNIICKADQQMENFRQCIYVSTLRKNWFFSRNLNLCSYGLFVSWLDETHPHYREYVLYSESTDYKC